MGAQGAKPFIPENSQNFDPHEYQGTISDLTPGQKYTFQIQAKTKIKGQKMPILAPPARQVGDIHPNIFESYQIFFLARSVFPTEVSRTMHAITVRLSGENGAVLGYSISFRR